MANIIRLSPADCVDGIPSTLIPASATSTLIGGYRFLPATELARWRFTCSGTSFQVLATRDSTTTVGGPNKDAFCAFVDGKDGKSGNDGQYIAVTPTNAVVAWYTVSGLTAGNHVVEIQDGQKGVSGSVAVGIHVLAVAGTNMALAPVRAARKLICIDNSELASCSGNLGQNDLMGLLRSSYPGRATAESLGGGTATMWSNAATFAARLVQHAAGAGTVDVLYWLGVNDYIGQLASIQTVVTSHLTAIMGLAGINRLVVLTPIPKGDETGARTLGQYRTDITNAFNAVSGAVGGVLAAKMKLISGTAIGMNLATNYLEAGAGALHPNDSGQLIVHGAVRGALGY